MRWLQARNGQWTRWAETRVLAHGPLGALTHGHHALKAHRPNRRHIVQIDLQVLPVPTAK